MVGGYDRETIEMVCDEKKSILNEGLIFFDHFNELLWEVCPLDKSHYCRKKCMDDHLHECKKKFLKGPRKVECPFNPLHIVNLMEITHHIMTCENRTVQTNGLCDFEPKRETVEGVAMEPLNIAFDVPNTWEDGQNPEFGYNGMDSSKFQPVIRQTPPGMTKSKKKAWKAQERQRFEWLTGKTREKPRGQPYPTINQIKNAKMACKEMSSVKNEADIIGIIDKLGSANIADPRDSMMKRINARLKVLQVMEAKLKEEKLELQRQVEQYLVSIGKTDQQPEVKIEPMESTSRNIDPRISGRNNNNEARSSIDQDQTTRFVPDMMTSAMVR